jgi:hypothetical protein
MHFSGLTYVVSPLIGESLALTIAVAGHSSIQLSQLIHTSVILTAMINPFDGNGLVTQKSLAEKSPRCKKGIIAPWVLSKGF